MGGSGEISKVFSIRTKPAILESMKGKLPNSFIVALAVIFLAAAAGIIITKTAFLSLLIIPLLIVAIVLMFLIFKNPELGWLLIIFFLPFERIPAYELGGVDIRINTLLGFLTLFAWVLALMFNPKKFSAKGRPASGWKVQSNILSIPLSIFVIALLLSLTQAMAFSRSVSVLVFIIFTIFLSILATNMIYSKESLRKTFLVLFLSSFIVGVFGLFQFGGDVIGLPQSITLLKKGYESSIFGFPRVQAFSMEPLYLANYLLIPIGVGLALFFNRVNIFRKSDVGGRKSEGSRNWWLVGLLALLLLIFILTVSRGGYFGLVGTFLVLGILLFKKLFTWRNILIGIVTIAVLVYGVSFALSKGETRAMGEFLGHIQLKDLTEGESIQGRLIDFKRGLNAWQSTRQSIYFGIGLANYGPWVASYADVPPIGGWKIINNQYIELLAETGLTGLIAYGLLLIVLIFRTFIALKYARDIFLKSVLIGLFAALVGVLIQYNFMSTLYIIHIWILIGMLVGVQNIILKNKEKHSDESIIH